MNATLLLTYSNHRSAVYTIEWSSDSTRIVTASDDRTVQIWDANSERRYPPDITRSYRRGMGCWLVAGWAIRCFSQC